MFFAGLAIFVLTCNLAATNSYFTIRNPDGTPADVLVTRFTNESYGVLLFAAIGTILCAFLGIFFIILKNRCYSIIFGTVLFCLWIIIIIVGSVLTTVSY